MNKILTIILTLFVLTACNSPKPKQEADSTQSVLLRKAAVKEVIQTTKYTYLYVREDQKEYWTAISKQGFNPGEEIFYMDDAVTTMVNFHSQELNRDFPTILFISQISTGQGKQAMSHPETMTQQTTMPQVTMGSDAHSGRKKVPAAENISVEPVGGLTIAKLYADKTKFGGKKVKVKGSVVKVNNQIMGRNWVHLQDGTKHGEEYDLTCTTQENVTVGEVITFEGIIGLDRDFTSGYFYPVIMEEAVVVN